MAEGERATGTPNTIYNLSSVLFHALEGGASYDTYVEDAEREGDEELTEFFRRVREEDRDRAAEARLLLAERTSLARGQEGVAASTSEGAAVLSPGTEEELPTGEAPSSTGKVASPRPELSGELPGTEPIRGEDPTSRTGEVPPPPEEVPPERAGEIPTAEEVPPPRAVEVPSGTPPQAPPGDMQREDSPPSSEEPPRVEREGTEREEDRGLLDRAIDKLISEEEQRGEGADRLDRR